MGKDGGERISLEIIAKDRNGLLHEIAKKITELDIAIVHHEARVCDNKNKGMVSKSRMEIHVKDHEQLEILIRGLMKIKGVIRVQEI